MGSKAEAEAEAEAVSGGRTAYGQQERPAADVRLSDPELDQPPPCYFRYRS